MLERAALWKKRTSEEKLLQLAGHLLGRALQEYNVVPMDEKDSYDKAVAVLHSRFDSSNHMLSAQEFRHAVQGDSFRRLNHLFQLAYGSETRETLVHTQLQTGLTFTLMRSPAVSGAREYKDLFMAARHAEKRISDLKRRQSCLKGDPRKKDREGNCSSYPTEPPAEPQDNCPVTTGQTCEKVLYLQ